MMLKRKPKEKKAKRPYREYHCDNLPEQKPLQITMNLSSNELGGKKRFKRLRKILNKWVSNRCIWCGAPMRNINPTNDYDKPDLECSGCGHKEWIDYGI